MLTAEMIRMLLDELRRETVWSDVGGNGMRLQRTVSGYRTGLAGRTQAVLSIMLEAAERTGQR
jgi:hypothetical protein